LPVQKYPQHWSSILYGARYDTWEAYTLYPVFLEDLTLQFGMKLTAATRKAYGRCGVACAELHVEHVPNAEASDAPVVMLLNSSRHHEWAFAPASNGAHFSTGAWRLPSYDDSSWSRSFGRLGLKKSKADKQISGDEHVVFFRTTFDVAFNPECARALQLRATLVQGGRVWLNGELLWSHNVDMLADKSKVAYEFANQEPKAKNGDDPIIAVIPESVLLLPGRNVLAVDVHELATRDAEYELLFDLEMSAFVNQSCRTSSAATSTLAKTNANTIAPGIVDDESSPSSGLSTTAIIASTVTLALCIASFGAYYYFIVLKRRVVLTI